MKHSGKESSGKDQVSHVLALKHYGQKDQIRHVREMTSWVEVKKVALVTEIPWVRSDQMRAGHTISFISVHFSPLTD